MMMSLPCQADDVIKLSSLKRVDFHSFTQSLNRKTNRQIKQERRKKRLLKLLRECADSLEGIASRSYVASMRSCVTNLDSSSSVYTSPYDSQDLIIFDDECGRQMYRKSELLAVTAGPHKTSTSSMAVLPRSDSKHLSEIFLRDHSDDPYSEFGNSDAFYASTDNRQKCKRFLTPKLRLANSFSSSYVEDSDISCSQSEDDVSGSTGRGWRNAAPVLDRTSRYSKLNEDDYRDLVCNGKSTAFLSQNEEDVSMYYEDEFGSEGSPLGLPLHNSDLEAAICKQYASLLNKANAEDLNIESAVSADALSTFSSDFENIFPASLSLHASDSVEEACSDGEESSALDESVPNYSGIPASTKEDYQLTFAQGGKSQCTS